jgi:ferric-dicitrate binding protein FerR (iron transport regulator)
MDKDYLIKKWLDDALSDKEQEAFDALEDSAFFKEIIEEGKRFKAQNPTEVVAYDELKLRLDKKKNPTTNWYKLSVRIAALFIVGFGLYFLTTQDKSTTFNTQLSQKQEIELPDGSVVVLNEASQVRFNKKNWDTQRNVELQGEAYFKVAKGKRFDVTTALGTVSVLGTQFKVSTRDSIFKVICYEGLVKVTCNAGVQQLNEGQGIRAVNDTFEPLDIATVQPDWLQNLKVFKQASMRDVFTALEKHYNVKINTDTVDPSILFTGAFELNNLDNALEAVTKTLNLTYAIHTNEVVVIKNAKN